MGGRNDDAAGQEGQDDAWHCTAALAQPTPSHSLSIVWRRGEQTLTWGVGHSGPTGTSEKEKGRAFVRFAVWVEDFGLPLLAAVRRCSPLFAVVRRLENPVRRCSPLDKNG
jgi:hypothetical protein